MINSFSLRLIPLRPLVNASGFYVWRQELSMIFESLEYFKENLRKHAKKRRNISFIYKVVLQILLLFFFFSFYYYCYSFLRGDHESENTWGNMNFLFMFGF